VQGFHATEKGIHFIVVTAGARYLALGGSDEVAIWELGTYLVCDSDWGVQIFFSWR
jgi:hypothetical protein